MAEDTKSIAKTSRHRGPKEENVKTYFTKNNLQFVSRKIPTLQEMIEEGSSQPRLKHECKLHTSWVSVLSQDNSSHTRNGGAKSVPRGQASPSTVSFATLYKATSTAKSNLPTIHEKNAYQKYILEQKRLAEKCLNVEEMQLERLVKENEEEIHKIAAQFCQKVKSWDEDDTTVSEALQSMNTTESDGANPSPLVAKAALDRDRMEKLVVTQDLSHLTNPEWVSSLFRISFTAPWSEGFSKVLKEQGGTNNVCQGLDIPVSEMREQGIEREGIEADKLLLKEAAKPKVAFGTAVPRAKGLEEYEEQLKPPVQRPHGVEPHKEQELPMDLITMQAVWGNQLNSRSTKHYCRHLRELIRQKIKGTEDASLSTVTMSQMKPKILLEAGMLNIDESGMPSPSSSMSSMSSSSSTPPPTTKGKKLR